MLIAIMLPKQLSIVAGRGPGRLGGVRCLGYGRYGIHHAAIPLAPHDLPRPKDCSVWLLGIWTKDW